MRKLSTKILITAFFLLGISQITKAQVSLYDFIQSTGTYTELTGATVLATATATTGTTSLDDNNYTLANGTIPFNFTYDGVVYTGCTVSTNGYITLGTTAPTTTSYTPLSATTAYAGAISAVGGNLNAYFVTGNAAQTGSISYQTVGVTPNRKFVIQYKNFKPQAQSGTTFSTAMNFQIVLNETSNAIDVIYNFTTGTYTAGSYQVGLRGANNTYPTSIKNRSIVTGTNTWATSINGTANTSTCGVSTTLLPASGLTFRYTPTSCPSPTSLSAAPITSSGATLTWTNPISGGTFTVEYGPAGFTPGTGTIATTTTNSLSIAGLLSQTSYSYYVQKSCGTGNNSLNVGPYNFTTGGPGEDCSTAPTLTIASSLATCSYTTVSTGISINGPTSFCSDINGNQATNDKWFKFVAPANGKKLVITTQAGTNNDWVMEVWTGCPGGTAYQFKCGDDNVIVNGQLTAMPEISMCQNEYVAGQTYYVRVWTYTPFAVGTMSICVYETTMCAVAPSNDNCVNAIRLTVNPPLSCATNTRTFLNNYATRNTDAATCDASLLKGDVWFVFNTGNFSDVDLTINAITAVNVKAQLLFECGGIEVSCWNPGTGTKTITGLNPQADYILRVWTDSTSAGTFSICITDRCSNPTATTSGSYTTCTGNSVGIPVTFTGTPPFALTYTNGTTSASVTGITTANYNLLVTPSSTSTYTLTAMNDATCIGSGTGTASVTVITPQTVTLNAFSPVCSNAPSQQLTGGSPSGGVYSGIGVTNGAFDPAAGTQVLTYTVTYTTGCTRSASQTYTVNPLPTVSLGTFSTVCNTAAPFALSGGSPTGGNYSGAGVATNTFNPSTAGIGSHLITYYYTTPAGCTSNDTASIIVTNCSVCTNAPTANAGTDKSICYNTTATIAATIGGSASSQTWSGGTGTYSPNNSSLNITYTPSAAEIAAGSARLILTTNDPDGNGPCVAASDTVNITINPAPQVGSISGSTAVCKNQTGVSYSVLAQAGLTYTWTVPTGVTITAGQGTNSITTTWGLNAVSGNIGISISNSCASTSGVLPVSVGSSPTTPTITGSASVCLNQTGVVYSIIAQTGATYTWTVPTGVTITTGQGTNSITTTWGSSAISGNIGISLTNSCGTTSGSLAITVGSSPTTPTITGSASVCVNQTGVIYSITAQTGATYTWTVPTGVTITAGQGTNSITTTWGSTAVSGTVGLSVANTCGISPGSLSVAVGTSPTTPTITGSTAVCLNQTGVVYSVTAQTGATYTWTVPTGVTITAGQGTNSITTTWGATAVSGTVGISVANTCGTSPGSLSVTVGTSPTTPTITGSTSVCLNQTGVIYSITAQTGATYTWTVPTGVTITSGQGTNSIITTWSASAVSGNVGITVTNSCGNTSANFAVTVGSGTSSPTISGSTAVCRNQTGAIYSVGAQTGATYTWTVPTGVTITAGQGTNSITTTWGATAVSGTVGISVVNTCGTSTGSLAITVGSSPTTPTITGSASVCLNQTGVVYIVTAQTGATYSWTVPTGVTITAGQGTNSITTTWGSTALSGNVGISLTNSCGTTSGSLAVTVGTSPTTPTITGSTSVCLNQTGVIYSITAQTGATYTWTLPTGVTITSGQGTNSITTTWGATAVSGTVGISVVNTCGTSTGSLAITVGSSPTTPTITGSASVCKNQTGVVYSVTAQTGVTYTWTVPTGVTITAGQGTNSITTTWASTTVAGNIGISITNTCGTSPGSLAVTVGSAPTAPTITGSASVCLNQTGVIYSVTAQTGVTYTWTVPTGVTITAGQGTNSITTTIGSSAVAGNIAVALSNSCATTNGQLAVAITPATSLSSISGSTSICLPQSQLIYSVTNQAGVTYSWSVPSGVTILSGQGTNQIITSWSATAASGNISVVATGTCNNASSSLPVVISSGTLSVGAITGNVGVCASTTGNIYSVVNQSGTTYTWSFPTGGTITAGQGTNSVTVSWSASALAGTIKVVGVKGCATDSSSITTILRTASPTQPSVITGNATMCSIDSAYYTITKSANADFYTWVPDTGMTINGSSVAITIADTIVKVVFSSAFTGDTIKVRAGNCKGFGAYRVLKVNKRTTSPSAITTITGQSTGLCGVTTATYSISAASGATNYTWRTNITGALINGLAVTSLTVDGSVLSVTITYPTAWVGSGNIYVKANNGCGSTAEIGLAVSSVVPTPGTITGSTSVCPNQTGVIYSIVAQAGITYNWTVPSGVTITSGQGTNSITTTWSSTAVTGNVAVGITSACGTSSNSLAVSLASGNLSVGPITGNSSNCKNTTGIIYSIPAITGASYTWTVPTGVTITAGQGTNSITTSWTASAVAGNVSITANTTCSSGNAVLPVAINTGLVVGAISGNSPICRPATGVIYSVAAQTGVTYVWTVPTGVTITAGAGTNSITTTWSSTSVTSDIKVVGTSACGKDSTTRNITVRTAVPTQPSTVTGATTACIGDALRFSITTVATADYYVWTPKTGMLINGSATALTTTDTAVTVTFTTGFVGDTLKVNGGNCKGLSTVRTKVITRNTAAPTTPGTVTGQTTGICGGGTYTYSFATAVTNATSYTWRTKTAGALLNGQAVSSLTVSAPTQSITVTYPTTTTTFDSLFVKSNNGCGSSAERGLKVNVIPATPGAITTPAVLCIGTTVPQVFSVAAVTGATSYTWTYPTTGTTYVSGQGTTSLTLRFTATGAKAITVKSTNACGSSTTSASSSVSPTAACPVARDGSAYDLSGIVVYPNPTRGNITVAFISNDNSDYDLVVLDMSGRVVLKQNVSSLEGYNQRELNLESLVKGTYIISLKGAGLVTQTRIIIE